LTEVIPPIVGSKALVIGDSLSTDVLFGKRAGFSTLLVETGTHRMKDVEEVIEKINSGDESEDLRNMIPDYRIDSMDEFYKKLVGKL
jgi:ribonucleotide monophosphatase NagD (HAD superfamily)